MTDKEIFDKKIIPIMNKVRDYIQNKQAEEMKEHLFSPASILDMSENGIPKLLKTT